MKINHLIWRQICHKYWIKHSSISSLKKGAGAPLVVYAAAPAPPRWRWPAPPNAGSPAPPKLGNPAPPKHRIPAPPKLGAPAPPRLGAPAPPFETIDVFVREINLDTFCTLLIMTTCYIAGSTPKRWTSNVTTAKIGAISKNSNWYSKMNISLWLIDNFDARITFWTVLSDTRAMN